MAFTPFQSSGFNRPSFPRSKSRRVFFQKNKDEHRINERIRTLQVRLIDETGNQVGIVSTQVALQQAREKGLDLMEISPRSQPPVCRICNYGKFKYEKKKKEQLAKKKQTVIKVKRMQLKPFTGEHDQEHKFKNVRQFLENGDKVEVSILFRGRELGDLEPGFKMMNHLSELLKDISSVESPPKLEMRKLVMILAPFSHKKKKS